MEEFLLEYLKKLAGGRTTRELFEQYRQYLDSCTASEVNTVIDRYIDEESDYDVIEKNVAKFIRACGRGLDSAASSNMELPFISILAHENSRLKVHRAETTATYKRAVERHRKTGTIDGRILTELQNNIVEFNEVKSHYLKLQNSLFPALEKYSDNMNCLKLMWHIQDEILDALKILLKIFDTSPFDFVRFNRVYGEMFLKMGNLIYREEKILFPLASAAVSERELLNLLSDIEELGTAYNVEISHHNGGYEMSEDLKGSGDGKDSIELSTGGLTVSQIDLMLTNLPFDITFVDENDNVRYFSRGKERIFPRSPGIIGRAVQNCHPPKSIHTVQKIIDDFKARKRELAEFWIRMDGKFIHIRYFPLFDGEQYKGVLEVSQEISGIRSLEGEKRLLDEE